jgi:hypothetical protein
VKCGANGQVFLKFSSADIIAGSPHLKGTSLLADRRQGKAYRAEAPEWIRLRDASVRYGRARIGLRSEALTPSSVMVLPLLNQAGMNDPPIERCPKCDGSLSRLMSAPRLNRYVSVRSAAPVGK